MKFLRGLEKDGHRGRSGQTGGIQMVVMDARCVRAVRAAVYAAEEDSRVVGFWSARLRYPTRRVPLKRAGSSLAGPRVNDHRKPMCVTSRGSEPYSVALLTRTT